MCFGVSLCVSQPGCAPRENSRRAQQGHTKCGKVGYGSLWPHMATNTFNTMAFSIFLWLRLVGYGLPSFQTASLLKKRSSTAIASISDRLDRISNDGKLKPMSSSASITSSRRPMRRAEKTMSCTRFRRHQVRCFMEREVRHGAKAVYTGVQA